MVQNKITIMKKIILAVTFLLNYLLSFTQTTTELSNILSAQSATATGTITTQNLVPAGTATAGSAVEIVLVNHSMASIQITGTYTGVLSVQSTVDGSNWITISNALALKNLITGVQSATIASATQSQFGLSTDGFAKIRVTGLAAMTGTATVTIKAVSGSPFVTLSNAIPTGTGSIGTVQPGNTANTTPWLIEPRTGTTNATTSTAVNSAASTNATNLKATAGMIFNITAMNVTASTKYIRIYNKATAPTVGTDIPVMVVAVPATSSKEITINYGLKLATGIGFAITGAATATDATAVAAGDVQLLINWQ